MAEPVQFTVKDLQAELGALFMEARLRAQREDEIILKLREAQQKIAQLESELAKAPKPEPKKRK